MTGLEDNVPLISTASEFQGVDFIRHVKTNYVENENLFSNYDDSSQPETETASAMEDQLNEERLQPSSSHESIGAVSDLGGSTSEASSSPDSGIRMEDDVGSVDAQSLDHCFDFWHMVDGERGIVFHPDFLRFPSCSYATQPVVMFLASCIQVKFSAANRDQEDFDVQLRLEDIINIESWWIGRVGTAKVKIQTISTGAIDAEGNRRFSGVEELKFLVKDARWYQKQEAIQSLDSRYNAIWTTKIDTEMDEYGETSEQNAVQVPRHVPEFEPFEDLIYPKGDPDAVSISKRDVDLLEPDTFLNDTIIDFYVKYLKDKIPPEKRQKYHFFNSFFFRKLGDLDKYSSEDFDGRSAFLRVRKWTRKFNLFEKDFVFIPVNHSYHWSLLVICHPGEVANFVDEDVNKLDRVPCILHMDSIRGTHVNLKNHIPLKDRMQRYLLEEWKERQKETSEDIFSKFSNLRFVSLELPQQQNLFDCGLFLLHYVESFLKEDPVSINPFKIRHKFLRPNWFPAYEPSLKRHEIWKLIHDLLKCHSQESSPVSDSHKCFPSNTPRTDDPTEFLPSSFIPSRISNGNLLCTQAEKGIEMNLFPASLAGSNCASNSGVAVRGPLEAGSAAGALLDIQYQAFDRSASFNEFRCAMASIQENVETCGNFVYTTATQNGLQIATEACDFIDVRADVSWDPEMSIHQTTQEGLCSSPVGSAYHSDKAFEVQVVEKSEVLQVQEVEKCGVLEVVDEKCEASRETYSDNEKRHALTETNDCLVDCSPSAPSELLQVLSNSSIQPPGPNDNSDPPDAFAKAVPELLDHGNGTDRHMSRTCDNGDDSELDSDLQHTAKKLRLTPSSEGELAISISNDLCL